MVPSRRTWNLGATPSLRGLWRVGRAPEPEPGMARPAPAPASPAARPFPHTGPGRLRTGRGKDTPVCGDEDSSARSAARPALAQCRALSVDWAGPGSPHGLYLTLQALQDKGCKSQSQGTKEEKLWKRQAPAPRRAREAREAGGTMNVENTGGRLFGSRRCSSLSGPPGAAPMVLRMVEAMSQLQDEKTQLQEELVVLQERLALRDSDQQATSTQLQNQVEHLKEKLISQAQEVSRLRSELGGTDLEKHRDLLMVENERLRQEMRRCEAELQELRTKPAGPCPGCEHSQESAQLRDKLSQLQLEMAESKGMLSELNLEVQQKTDRLAEVELRLKDCLAEKAQEEERLSRRLRDSHETIASLRAQSPPVKYVIKTVEVESSKTKQALSESQARNQHLQEQVAMQRQVLKEMEQQLQSSHQLTARLRAQIAMYESELERAHGQMLEEMQSLEEDKNRAIEEAFARAQVEMKAVHENLAGVRTNLLTLQPALRTLTNDYNGLKRQVRGFPLLLQEALRSVKAEIGQAIEEVNSNNQELLRKYRRELQLRKKCHNELVRLKGNIRVIARVRPVTKEDGEGPEATNAVTFDADDDSIIHLLHKGKPVSFELDKVFSPQASQQDVFQEVQALVTSCIDGFNVCIFAYGQTGAGKTYTMEGTAENPGINQRALQLLFSEVQEKASDWEYTITVSAAEIYNEVLRDLLGKEPQEKLEIRLCPDGSGQLYVPGLTEFQVQSVDDINKVFEFGHTNRTTEFTNLNEHSSRSHALLIVTVRGVDCSTGLRTTGKLNLVDLAGSERVGKSGAEGSRLREAQHINKSLSALGDVIAALRSRQGHVPFRNSKLTYLLQDSLSGDSKTLMVVQVSPVEKNTSETLYSLKFAERVRSVELGPGLRRAELGSWSSQEHLEWEPACQTPQPSARAHSAPSSGTSSRPGSIRRKLQPSGKSRPLPV
ncbi:kinesin-like protein KIFC3 isoform X5 [Homo sapiens]|uniref:kinesin-like protein KIFC3 isoform X5 n=1 Tax=Homo sapiens TaxID=9606 RepID=UPI000387B332|nr:kinesin-like protein KIFC3 isoform X5 [Homo sapiens]XP_047290036.1 kinesin-like protein KIFC3 isoform X5 [Homo sapiens]XP_054236260.1 kinesin-like protein KIFC3 isoform X5 [Homo sapiens]XP_054236261.1 kinesin-like protein KIFC3 isoform X5 [Homo sapiens]